MRVQPDSLRRVRHQPRCAGKRTKRAVAHKRQDPDRYDAKVAERAVFKNRPSRA